MTENITNEDIEFVERQLKWSTSEREHRGTELMLKLTKAVKELQDA